MIGLLGYLTVSCSVARPPGGTRVFKSFLIAAVISSAQSFTTEARAEALVDSDFRVTELDFATPEAAVGHFFKSIVKNDLAAALQAFATNEYADNYDFTKHSRRMAAIQPMMQPAPPEYAMYDRVNRLALLARYAQQIQIFTYSLTPDIQIDQTQRIDNDNQIAAFVTSVDPAKLGGLTIAKAYKVVPASEKFKSILAGQADPLGADEIGEIVILYELGGRYLKSGARLLRYGQFWRIDSLNSIVAEVPMSGGAVPTTEEEFDAFIADPETKGNWTYEAVFP
jgi:hypothetical protein